MHEASLVAGILQTATDEVAKYNATTPPPAKPVIGIKSLTVELGFIACVEEQTLTGCFELVAEGTLAEGAELRIVRKPLPCTCTACNAEFLLEKRHFVCPFCGSQSLETHGGHGCMLVNMDVCTEE